MKKLLSFPPAMVFMLLEHCCGVQTVPENDIMGGVTQLMFSGLTGGIIPYFEYYEFFRDGVLVFEQLTPLGELSVRWIEGHVREIVDDYEGTRPIPDRQAPGHPPQEVHTDEP